MPGPPNGCAPAQWIRDDSVMSPSASAMIAMNGFHVEPGGKTLIVARFNIGLSLLVVRYAHVSRAIDCEKISGSKSGLLTIAMISPFFTLIATPPPRLLDRKS